VSEETTPYEFIEPVDILLVDDDDVWTRATASLLEHAVDAFRVDTASSLEDGQSRYVDTDPDCVVCDYQLGDGIGFDLLETVQADEPSVPFILVTGRGDEHLASTAIHNDVTDYVIKAHDEDAALLADCIATAVDAFRTERALERERESKASILELLRATTDERTLCQEFCTILVENHGYSCAWIGTKTSERGLITQAAAGPEPIVDDLVQTPTAAEKTPTLEAAATNESVVWDLTDQSTAWAATARAHDLERAAGIPIQHEGIRFGVLGVYAAGRPPLDETNLESLNAFAETFGYALHTADFKHSMGPDETVTVDIELTDTTAPLCALGHRLPDGTRLLVLSTVVRNDDTTLYFLRLEGANEQAVADAVALSDEVEFANDGPTATGSTVQCGLIATEPTPESTLTATGGSVQQTVVEDTTAAITAELPDHGTVSTAADALESIYENVIVTAIRQNTQSEPLGTVETLLEPMTTKQADALRHAYAAGFFEHPRETTMTELADQFGVTRQTVTHHLRAAERKLLDQIFES